MENITSFTINHIKLTPGMLNLVYFIQTKCITR